MTKNKGHIMIGWVTIFLLITTFSHAQKINGMSFSGPGEPTLTQEMFEDIKISNANWVALIPEVTLDRYTLTFREDADNDWWSETIEANIQSIQLAKKAGLKVFLKPHLVLGKYKSKTDYLSTRLVSHSDLPLIDKTRGAEWRGTLSFKKEQDWQQLEKEYEAYILKLAKVAAILEVDLFSIGTELKEFAIKRPQFWSQLIQQVRGIYSGSLTYAANWDEYHKIGFWQNLDYIGVDTYFPVSRAKTPDVKKTIKNWRSIQKQLKKLSKSQDRPILLTEFGYRNISYAGKRPWTHDKGEAIPQNYQAQVNLLEAFFQTFWKKSWVAGGFSWKWFASPKSGKDTTFSVQGKPALKVVQHWYEQTH